MSPYYELYLLAANFKMPQQEALLKKYCTKTRLIKSSSAAKRYLFLITALLGLRRKKFDVLYTNGIGSSILLTGKIVRYKKWVLHHHMEADAAFFTNLSSLYKKAMQLAGNVIACSPTNSRYLSEKLQRQVDVVYCFSRDLGGRQSHEKTSTLRFGYFGRLIAAKGIDLLCRLSADADCSHIHFHIWGAGKEYPASFFEQYPNLVYHGSFDTETALKDLVDSLDAFLLLTSHAEGLPVSLLEIMSAGVPWISTSRGGIPDIACDARSTRIIEIDDYAVVKQSVLQLAEDILGGHISTAQQVNLYQASFAAKLLIKKWQAIYNN